MEKPTTTQKEKSRKAAPAKRKGKFHQAVPRRRQRSLKREARLQNRRTRRALGLP